MTMDENHGPHLKCEYPEKDCVYHLKTDECNTESLLCQFRDRLNLCEAAGCKLKTENARLLARLQEAENLLLWVKSPAFYCESRIRRNVPIVEFLSAPSPGKPSGD